MAHAPMKAEKRTQRFTRAHSWILAGLFGLAAGSAAAVFLPVTSAAIDTSIPDGEELVFLYIGAKACAFSNRPEVVEAVIAAKNALAERSAESGLRFVRHGVAIDWRVSEAYEHLRGLGDWDELSLGRNWTNNQVLKSVWDHGRGPSTPSILLIRRVIRGFDEESGAFHPRIVSEEIVRQIKGVGPIVAWVRNGTPIESVFSLNLPTL